MTWDESKHPRAKDGEFGNANWAKEISKGIGKDIGKNQPPLSERLKSGEVSTKKLSGGSQAKVDLVTLGDGSKIVRKTTKKKNQARQLDAEELSAQFARKLGITAPAVHRDSQTSVVMDHMDGKIPMDANKGLSDADRKEKMAKIYNSKDGIKLGLFDLVTHNVDRNNGNYMISPDGQLQAIDHGMAFQEPGNDSEQSLFSGMNPFINVIAGVTMGPNSWLYKGEPQPKSSTYSKADIAHMRKQLKSLESEFKRLGRENWYANAHDQLDKLSTLATGKGKLF